MATRFDDPDLEDCMAASVDRGDFDTIEAARADFLVKLDASIAEADRGETFDLETAWAQIRERLTSQLRAAE